MSTKRVNFKLFSFRKSGSELLAIISAIIRFFFFGEKCGGHENGSAESRLLWSKSSVYGHNLKTIMLVNYNIKYKPMVTLNELQCNFKLQSCAKVLTHPLFLYIFLETQYLVWPLSNSHLSLNKTWCQWFSSQFMCDMGYLSLFSLFPRSLKMASWPPLM